MKVVNLPCFGNCFANAIAHQLGYPSKFTYIFRIEVVEHLELHREEYFLAILTSCYKTYRHEIIANLTPSKLVDRYLRDLKHRKVICGAECLSVICNLRHIKINLYSFEHPQKVTYTPWSGIYIKEINLIYYGRHYYSVVF